MVRMLGSDADHHDHYYLRRSTLIVEPKAVNSNAKPAPCWLLQPRAKAFMTFQPLRGLAKI